MIYIKEAGVVGVVVVDKSGDDIGSTGGGDNDDWW